MGYRGGFVYFGDYVYFPVNAIFFVLPTERIFESNTQIPPEENRKS